MKRGEFVKASRNTWHWGVDGWTFIPSKDVKLCESILMTTLNDTFNAADLLSSIETQRKVLYKEDHTLIKLNKLHASDELSSTAKEQLQALRQELQQASSKLTTTKVELQRRFPYCQRTAKNSRRKKENKRKARKLKEKRMQQRAMSEPSGRYAHLKGSCGWGIWGYCTQWETKKESVLSDQNQRVRYPNACISWLLERERSLIQN